MQVEKGKSTGFGETIKRIVGTSGPTGLYKGLSSGLVRQLTYGLTKFGVYAEWEAYAKAQKRTMPFAEKLFAGAFSGACAALTGNPAEVALVRTTADSKLPVEQRRNYTNVFNAMSRIVKEEGASTLWRGLVPHVYRAGALSAAQLATFGESKELLQKHVGMKNGLGLTFWASMVSGVACAVAACPMDVIKTRIQNMKSPNGVPEYSGSMDCVLKTVKNEGPMAMMKGFTGLYIKLAPYTTIVFIAMEQINKAYDSFA
jgi:solute carrier family 25 oxoglutarate transporter 11